MRTPWIWSVSLGRWWNVHVRLHLFFFLFAVFAIHISTSTALVPNWVGYACPVLLFASVLLHEIGHVLVARKLGGQADEVVIGPLGGLSAIRVPYEPHSELVAIMAGTLVSASICFVCALSLVLLQGNSEELVHLLGIGVSYFDPKHTFHSVQISLLQLLFWLNWSLILVNLIPCFPFDGGRSLQAVLSFLWPEAEPKQTLITLCRLGKVVSVILLVLAWYTMPENDPIALAESSAAQPPAWIAYILLSIYVFFCSRREELQQAEVEHDDDTVFGYDFSQGYTSLERSLAASDESKLKKRTSAMGYFRAWVENRRAEQLRRQEEQEREDETRVDEILTRLHEGGMHSLSPDDQALLNRVSQRYRSRPTQGP